MSGSRDVDRPGSRERSRGNYYLITGTGTGVGPGVGTGVGVGGAGSPDI